ncbi:MAG TPA: VOC family protein [Elusimicrobiales bacterium]|nr:VOC family protein [Elusimicrobiales bacterium]
MLTPSAPGDGLPRPPIGGQIIFLHTGDLAKTGDFYERVLGLPLAADQGDCRIYRVSRDGYIGFCGRAPMPDRPETVIITLVSEDVDGWRRFLESKGAECETRPVESPAYGIYHFFLRDPNGYRIEIQRFLSPDWDVSREDEMSRIIRAPAVIPAHGNQPKIIKEFIGRVNSGTEGVSIAWMKSPEGWTEPGQTPEFDEYTLVLKGRLRIKTRSGTEDIGEGEAFIASKGEWVQYSSPHEGGAEYVAVCAPAFSPDLVHRD